MQFADVNVNNVKSKFWRRYISMFQWNEWPCMVRDRCVGCKTKKEILAGMNESVSNSKKGSDVEPTASTTVSSN